MFAIRSLAVALVLAAAGSASAGIVTISPTAPASFNSVIGSARFRGSYTNWDQGLIQGTTVTGGLSANTIGFGASSAMSTGDTFRFTLEHVAGAGAGLKYSLQNLTANTAAVVQSWGSASLGGANAATINSVGAEDGFYNTLHVFAIARNRTSGATILQDNLVSWSNISFSATGLTNVGALTTGALQPGAASSATLTNDQWLVSDTDLRTVNWTLQADVIVKSITLSGGPADPPGTGENLKFEVSLKDAVVPAPGAAALVGLAGLAALRRRR